MPNNLVLNILICALLFYGAYGTYYFGLLVGKLFDGIVWVHNKLNPKFSVPRLLGFYSVLLGTLLTMVRAVVYYTETHKLPFTF